MTVAAGCAARVDYTAKPAGSPRQRAARRRVIVMQLMHMFIEDQYPPLWSSESGRGGGREETIRGAAAGDATDAIVKVRAGDRLTQRGDRTIRGTLYDFMFVCQVPASAAFGKKRGQMAPLRECVSGARACRAPVG